MREWCDRCYARLLSRGVIRPLAKPSTEERFWEKVDALDACWLWRDVPAATGYGLMSVDGKRVLAHRLSYELNVGPIPAGMQIDHLCYTRSCVRPDHLEAVPQAENIRRAFRRRETCKHGHPKSPENTIRHGARTECRECNRRRCQEYAARRKAARTS